MKINREKIQKLANLSRLNLSDSEIQDMLGDLQEILNFIDKLATINTDKIQPLTHIHQKTNIYREDNVTSVDIKRAILNNAPNHDSDYIKVPKVLKRK